MVRLETPSALLAGVILSCYQRGAYFREMRETAAEASDYCMFNDMARLSEFWVHLLLYLSLALLQPFSSPLQVFYRPSPAPFHFCSLPRFLPSAFIFGHLRSCPPSLHECQTLLKRCQPHQVRISINPRITSPRVKSHGQTPLHPTSLFFHISKNTLVNFTPATTHTSPSAFLGLFISRLSKLASSHPLI